MNNRYEYYYNLPRNSRLEQPLRETRAVREALDEKIKDMTSAEMTAYFRQFGKKYGDSSS